MNESSIEAATSARPNVSLVSDQWRNRSARLIQWAVKLAEFGVVQGFVQLFLAAAGLIIVRTLPKSEYALFAIANSMQTSCNLLADLGIGIGVRSIGGRVWNDRFRFGQLLNTVLGLRRQFALISLTVCLPIAAWMLLRNGAGISVTIGLCLAITASVIPLLGVTAWVTSAQLHGEYRRIQKLDLGNAAMRCGLIGLLALSRMNAILATLVGVVGNWIQGWFLRRWANEKIVPELPPNAQDRTELLRLSFKALPNTIFFCFQGQVTLLILTLVGNRTGIADVTALSRVSMFLTIFSTVFSNVLAPRFARCQESARLRRLYCLLLGGTILVLLLFVLSVWLLPGLFIWLLGPRYAGLERELGLIVATSCISQVGAIMWNLNSSKAWMDTIATAHIPTTMGIQILAALLLDLRSFEGVLIFNLLSATIPLPLYAADAISGLCRARKLQLTVK